MAPPMLSAGSTLRPEAPLRIALYPGSFDPLTRGHVTIVQRSRRIFDEVVVAVARNVSKKSLFTIDERVEMAREVFAHDDGIRVETFDGLLVEYARSIGATALLRGLRAVADFEYENQMASMNHMLAPDIETVFLMADAHTFFVSSRLVKEVASLGGDVSTVVPPAVYDRLIARLARTNGES